MDTRRTSYEGILTKDQSPLPAKAEAAEGILSGYGSNWWVVDSYAECTAPGSFLTSIADRGPSGANRIFLRYEHVDTCGIWTALAEDAVGLRGDAFIKDDGDCGSLLRNHLSEPHPLPYGLSIGFRRMRSRPANENDPLDLSTAPEWVKQLAGQDIGLITVLTEVKLVEISAVTFPAVEPSLVDSYRSDDLNGRALARVLAGIKSGRLTPDHIATLKQIATALPAERTPENARDARSTTPPSDSTRLRRIDLELALINLGV